MFFLISYSVSLSAPIRVTHGFPEPVGEGELEMSSASVSPYPPVAQEPRAIGVDIGGNSF